MDIQEVRMRRHSLQDEIRRLLKEFSDDTGLTVTYINVDGISSLSNPIEDYRVTVDVELR